MSRERAQALGDMRKNNWAGTIQEQHPWLLTEPQYAWKFLEGFFDNSGGVYVGKNKNSINLSTVSQKGTELLTDLLEAVGIKKPLLMRNKKGKEGVSGVRIANLPDIKRFAEHVMPKDNKKSELLKALRQRYEAGYERYTDEEIAVQWKHIIQELGSNPKKNDIQKLRKKGEVSISPDTMVIRFGGDWKTAQERLNQLIGEEERNQDIQFLPRKESVKRSREMRGFVNNEIERFKMREITSLSSITDIAEQFGQTYDAVYSLLRYHGIQQERQRILKKEFDPNRLMSKDGAWMLGVLSGSGSVSKKTGAISMNRHASKKEILEAFKATGERLFGIPATDELREMQNGENRTIRFSNKDIANAFGDLRKENWAKTLNESHQWLLTDQKNIWTFLEGFHESNGALEDKNNRNTIRLHTTSLNGTNLLKDLLMRVGIKKPNILLAQKAKEKVAGVSISNLSDINHFAHHVTSVDPDKRERLEALRIKRPQSRVKFSEEEIISAWTYLTKELGKTPKPAEIKKLNKEGKTRISYEIYKYRFGEGNWQTAQESLNNIIAHREESSLSGDMQPGQEINFTFNPES